jgi:tetratricopeptide (TPR) repeat protein
MESSRLEEFDSAIEACSKAIELDPGNIFAHRLRGLAYEKTGDPRKAVQDCEAAERLGDRECRSWLKQAARKGKEKEGGTLTLLCRVSFAGGPPGDYSLVVNLTSGTVNGWKASINDNVIQWKQKGAWFRVDRYTGAFDGGNTEDDGAYSGKCAKTTEKRQF